MPKGGGGGMESYGATVLRIVLGVIYIMHAYLALVVFGPSGMVAYQAKAGVPFPELATWYLILAHSIGGLLLILGLWARWAAVAQLPIMASAFFLHHLRQGFFLTGIVVDPAKGIAIAGGYEYVLLILAATLTLVLAGGGALAIDQRSR